MNTHIFIYGPHAKHFLNIIIIISTSISWNICVTWPRAITLCYWPCHGSDMKRDVGWKLKIGTRATSADSTPRQTPPLLQLLHFLTSLKSLVSWTRLHLIKPPVSIEATSTCSGRPCDPPTHRPTHGSRRSKWRVRAVKGAFGDIPGTTKCSLLLLFDRFKEPGGGLGRSWRKSQMKE